MSTVFPSTGFFQHDNMPCCTVKFVHEWFEVHDKEFMVLTWPPNSEILNPIEHLWHGLESTTNL